MVVSFIQTITNCSDVKIIGNEMISNKKKGNYKEKKEFFLIENKFNKYFLFNNLPLICKSAMFLEKLLGISYFKIRETKQFKEQKHLSRIKHNFHHTISHP